MADDNYSESAFLGFLRQAAVAGVIKPATARSRKLAAEQLLVQLKSHERLDLRLVDVEELCSRYHKLQGSTIREESLALYGERLKSGLTDFFAWNSSPTEFSSTEDQLPQAKLAASLDTPGQALAREELALDPPRNPHDIFPVPIREDLVVYLQNVPLDLTQTEARKIAAVIHALALPDEK